MRLLCAIWGGHCYDRRGDYLVCMHCGHKVSVKR